MKALTPEQSALAARYVPMARSLARPYRDLYPNLRDEIEEAACMGLVSAAGRFDPARGVRFSTFARRRIIGSIQDAIASSLRFECSYEDSFVVVVSPAAPVGQDLEQDEDAARLLRRFPAGSQKMMWLFFVEGYTFAEVAEAMGRSTHRVKREIYAALDAARLTCRLAEAV